MPQISSDVLDDLLLHYQGKSKGTKVKKTSNRFTYHESKSANHKSDFDFLVPNRIIESDLTSWRISDRYSEFNTQQKKFLFTS